MESILAITLAAVAGDSTNFAIDRSQVGQYLLKSAWTKPHHLVKTRTYFDRFSGPTVTIGRLVPVVRSTAPLMAGISGMCQRRFAFFNVVGALVWYGSLIMALFSSRFKKVQG